MKKNITVNLFGSLYAIDEDASQLLEQYLDNMKSYFSRREGGDEIADDIEHRVAEIFADLKAQGVEAISISHVQDIIRRIGNPEQMDSDNAASEGAQGDSSDAFAGQQPPEPPRPASGGLQKRQRKLFRDPDDVMIGGVMAGLCKYFGATDPLPWRFLMVLLALASLSTMGVIYLVAWAIIPQAHTAEERLQMKGEPVNPETLNEELMRTAGKARDYVQSPAARGCLSTLLTMLLTLFKLALLFLVCLLLGMALICGGALLMCIISGFNEGLCNHIIDGDLANVIVANHAIGWQLWGVTCLATVVLVVIFYALVRWLLAHRYSKPVSPRRIVAGVLVVLIATAAALSMGIMATAQIDRTDRDITVRHNSRAGYFLFDYQREKLADEGWEILDYKNCNPDGNCLTSEISWTDVDNDGSPNNTSVMRFERDKLSASSMKGIPMQVNLQRSEEYPAGNYRLQVIARAKGNAAYAYVLLPGNKRIVASMPRVDDDGKGNLCRWSRTSLIARGIISPNITDDEWDDTFEDEVEKWNLVEKDFHHDGGPLRVGITSLPSVVNLPATSSPREFMVRSIKIIPMDQPVHATPTDSIMQ